MILQAAFVILALMIIIFYILVVLQIALALLPMGWVRVVPHGSADVASSHAGFYASGHILICLCKGIEPGLDDNLTLTRFEYELMRSIFARHHLDPALKIIERVKAVSQRPVHIVIAGPPQDCGEKVYNLRRAVEALLDQFEVLVFTDSTYACSGWLSKLVALLQDPRIGATTTYRWLIPSRRIGDGGLSSAFAPAWNAAIVTLLGRPSETFCWGGGTAIRRKMFDDVNVLEAWQGAVSDDSGDDARARTSWQTSGVLSGMPRGNGSSVDGLKSAGIHRSPGFDHACLFSAPVGARSGRPRGVCANADLCRDRDFHHDGRRRPLGAARADDAGDSPARNAQRRGAHDCRSGIVAGGKATERMGLYIIPCLFLFYLRGILSRRP